MSDIGLVAAVSNAHAQAEVASAIGVKVLKLANEQQQSVATLVESAVAAAAETLASSAQAIDIQA